MDLFRIISIFYLTWPTQIWVIAIGFRTWFWISKCEKPHAYWGNKHEWCKQFKFFNFVDTLQPQKLMLMWNSYGFSPKIKAKDLLEIVYVTSTIYMIHYNVPSVVSVCILSSVYQNLGYFEITLSLNLSLKV